MKKNQNIQVIAFFLVALAAARVSCAKKCELPLQPFNVGIGIFEEEMVPMRDGVKLHTVAISPPFSERKQFPTVIDRSPYGFWNTELLGDIYLLFDFAAVSQDQRGTCQSEGNFSIFHKDLDDGMDTLSWIGNKTWSDGKVFQIGASADGIAALELARGHPKALQGQFIIFATGEAKSTFFPGGAMRDALISNWITKTVPLQSAALLQEIRNHEVTSTSWWSEVELHPLQFQHIDFVSVHWAGWFDIFLRGHLYTFEGYQKLSQPSVRGKHYLVVDPLGHCQSGASYFRRNLIEGRSILPVLLGIQLFKGELSGSPAEKVDHVTFYVMGSAEENAKGGYWVTLPDWPSFKATKFYAHGDKNSSLLQVPPPAPGTTPGVESSSSYRYDPSFPVPSAGGNNLMIACGPLDQLQIESRSDVVTFTTPPLEAPLALTGPIVAELFVSTENVNDTDFTAKLTDVYPNGSSYLIQDGIQRMRWRGYFFGSKADPNGSRGSLQNPCESLEHIVRV